MKQRFNSFIACQCSMPGSAVKRAAMLLLLSVLTTVSVWAENDFTDNGDGTYTINNAEGWGLFCDALQDNETYNRFSGKTVYLGADIGTAQNPITRMAGTSKHDFCGTFDGQGYTLTVNISSDKDHDYTAPFSYISVTKANPSDENDSPAAIRNLHVAGTVTATKDYAGGIVGAFWGTLTIENCTSSVTINTNNKHAAGFISRAAGDTITITNCLSNVTITGTISGDGTHAGFIGASASGIEINITGCAFTGSLLGTNTTHCAGFVGYNSGTLTITHSLLAPANVTVGDTGSATFARGNVPTLSNCYYTDSLGTAQGKQRRRIIAGDYVTVTTFPTGNYTTYNVSRILGYTGGGLIYADGGVRYYGKDDPVLLSLSHSDRAGYNFNHYTISAGKAQGVIITMPDEDVTVGASWDLINYNISYNFNGGALRVGDSNPVSYNVETPTFTLCEPVKNHYDFAGWYINDAFTGDTVTSIKIGTTGIINLYAKWTPVTYNISYDLAGGELPAGKSNPDSYNIESADITLNIPVKDGYIFAGWTGTDLDAPTYKVIITTGSVEDREYTATWVKAVSVNYIDENGEEQTTIAHSLNGSETALTPGWYFVQNTNPAGVDLAYENALSCSNGDLNIVLCDGAEMSVNVEEGKALSISGDNRTLTIYGQSEGTGRLTVTGAVSGENPDGTIDVSNMIINGGIVNATSNVRDHAAIHSNVTLNHGQLNVGNNENSLALEGDLTVNGGQFVASSSVLGTIYFNGGTFNATAVGDDEIYLNWTSHSDRFYAGSIEDNVYIADGKIFVDEDGTLYQPENGGLSDHNPTGKTLRPFTDYEVPIDLASSPFATTATLSWTGFQDEYNVRLRDAATNVFFSEGFEGGSMPTGWSTTDSYWKITSGTGHEDHTGAATGSYNAGYYVGSYDNSDILITPAMDLSSTTSATLNFNFWNTNWSGDINTLNVYYRVDGGDWNLLYTNGQEVSSWTPVKVALEGLAANYQIGFECVGKYSYGMGIDDVVVAQNSDWTYMNNVTSPLNFTGLTPNTNYEWQVQGIHDKGVTEWGAGTFTTDELNIVLYNNGSEALDNASAVSDNNGIVAHNVTLSGRTLYKDGDWNTLCLPFNVTIDESPLAGDKVVAKVLSEKSELVGDRLTLNFNDAPKEIPAGTPFIIKWDKGDDLVNPVFENVTIDKTSRDFKFTGGTFKGNYAPLEITDDNRNDILLLSSGNRLGYAKTDRTIENGKALGACRAYFDIPSDNGVKAARQFTLNFGDEETTGIIEVNTNLTNKAADAFDLQGRRIENPKKGLYIVKGKKVVIK